MIIPRDIILRRSDVLYTLRSRPAVRNDLEIPLRIGKTLGRIEDIFPCGFEELQGLVLVRLRELLRARADPVQDIIKVQQITRANGAEMRFIICPFPKLEYEAPPNGSLKSVKATEKRRAGGWNAPRRHFVAK